MAGAIPKAERYKDAENVFREHEPKLTRLARGERLTWLMYMGTCSGLHLSAVGRAIIGDFGARLVRLSGAAAHTR